MKVFVQDPEIQLKELGTPVADLIDPSRPAVLDAAHRSIVNYEIFFFADEGDKKRFDADPTASCGVLTDPVTKQRFKPGGDAPRSSFDGRAYLFINLENKATFDKAPEAFARPNYDSIEVPGMAPMPTQLPTPPPAQAP